MGTDKASKKAGQLIVLSAPSGAGKTTLVHALEERLPEIRFSVSYTTRPKRDYEVEGMDYRFVDAATFKGLAEAGEFLEHALVFKHHYATHRGNTEALVDAGLNVILEIDWQGARQVRAATPECCSIFILPPSMEVLEERLRGRGSDSEASIRRRLREARDDMTHWIEFDYAMINDEVDVAADTLVEIITGDNLDNRVGNQALRKSIATIVAS